MEHGQKYHYGAADLGHHCAYLLPAVREILSRQNLNDRRIFDLGCGNGSVAAALSADGYSVVGVDPSTDGINMATRNHPLIQFFQGSAYDDLSGRFGTFPVVISLEVIEHIYAPRDFARTLYNLVAPGGLAIVSTPYHGYVKNVVMAAFAKLDDHFTALWDNGHIKFWSIRTLRYLLSEASFSDLEFQRVGRMPLLAKSMIAVGRKL